MITPSVLAAGPWLGNGAAGYEAIALLALFAIGIFGITGYVYVAFHHRRRLEALAPPLLWFLSWAGHGLVRFLAVIGAIVATILLVWWPARSRSDGTPVAGWFLPLTTSLAALAIGWLVITDTLDEPTSVSYRAEGTVALTADRPWAVYEVTVTGDDLDPENADELYAYAGEAVSVDVATLTTPDCTGCIQYRVVFRRNDDAPETTTRFDYLLVQTLRYPTLGSAPGRDAISLAVTESAFEARRLQATSQLQVTLTPERPFDLVRFRIDIPAAAMIGDSMTAWPVFWSVETSAWSPDGGQRFLWEGYPARSDPIRAGCAAGADCSITRYVPVFATRVAATAVNDLTATVTLDYLAAPFPDQSATIAVEIDTPTEWYDEVFSGRTPAGEDQTWLIEFLAGTGDSDGRQQLPLLATVGYRRNAFDYVDVANTFGCSNGTCSIRLEVPGSDVPWTGGLHWPFFGLEAPPDDFMPGSPQPGVSPYG